MEVYTTMNRSNVGNIVTNAQQVLSVGAFTAGGYRRSLAKAEQTLNNRAAAAEGALNPEEEARYRAMKSGKKMEDAGKQLQMTHIVCLAIKKLQM